MFIASTLSIESGLAKYCPYLLVSDREEDEAVWVGHEQRILGGHTTRCFLQLRNQMEGAKISGPGGAFAHLCLPGR